MRSVNSEALSAKKVSVPLGFILSNGAVRCSHLHSDVVLSHGESGGIEHVGDKEKVIWRHCQFPDRLQHNAQSGVPTIP